MKANARPRRIRADDDGVSDVIGAILLVGITVAMMVGLSALMLNLDGPRDRIHIDLRMSVLPGGNGWGTGDEVVRIEHVGGEPMPQVTSRITLDINGTALVIAGSSLDQGFADGWFRIGDVWQRTQTIQEGEDVLMLLIDDEGNAVTTRTQLTARGTGSSTGGGGGGTSGIVTYVSSGAATQGTLTNFAAMQSASDSGAAATLSESSSGGVGSSSTRSPASVSTSTSVTNPNNVLTSNDVRATMSANGAITEVTGFTMPVTGVTITSVTLGMEAQRGTGSGSGSSMILSYEVGTVPGATSGTHTVTSTSDAQYTTAVTSDRTWTVTAINSLTVIAERTSGSRATLIDHLYVTVGYTTPLVTDAQAVFTFAAVPGDSADNHQLQIRYRTSIETFRVEVLTGPATWNTRGTLNSALSYSVFTHTLDADEYNAGAPQVRITDLDTGSVAGSVQLEYMRIDTT